MMQISIGVSARHVHLTQEHLEILFGSDYQLGILKELSQPGEFASHSKVSLKTEKDIIEGVRILGPVRSYTQVEISKTDAVKLGLNPPVRDSEDILNSSPITIIGPNGTVDLEYGCIIATRHIHLTKEDLKKYDLDGFSKVKVLVQGIKGGILDNVSLKVDDNYAFEMHVDTDDANAHLINQGDFARVIVGDENV